MNTGTAPYCMIGAIVVGNPQATVMTSSPGIMRRSSSEGDVSAIKARRLADDPELVNEQYERPRYLAKSDSNCAQYFPEVSQKSSEESTRDTISFSSKYRPP